MSHIKATCSTVGTQFALPIEHAQCRSAQMFLFLLVHLFRRTKEAMQPSGRNDKEEQGGWMMGHQAPSHEHQARPAPPSHYQGYGYSYNTDRNDLSNLHGDERAADSRRYYDHCDRPVPGIRSMDEWRQDSHQNDSWAQNFYAARAGESREELLHLQAPHRRLPDFMSTMPKRNSAAAVFHQELTRVPGGSHHPDFQTFGRSQQDFSAGGSDQGYSPRVHKKYGPCPHMCTGPDCRICHAFSAMPFA